MHQEHTQEDKSGQPDLSNIELSDVIDAVALQGMMDDYYDLTGIGIGILDLKGKVLVGTGWQDICVKFHRAVTESCKFCHDSDIFLSINVPPGTFKAYRCKNNMWDIATPIMHGDRHIGNIFLGQFLYNDEEPDYDLFRAQARRFGYDEAAYIEALDRVPRYSRASVQAAMSFYSKLTQMLSRTNYNNVLRANAMVAEMSRKDDILVQQNRLASMGEMIHNIAHQWRQPLNTMGLIVQCLLLSYEEGELTAEDMREEVTRTMDLVTYMSNTIEDFVNLFEFNKESKVFIVNQVVSRALSFVSPALNWAGIKVELNEQTDVSAKGNPNEYLQTILNIINNAKDVLLELKVDEPLISIRICRENNRSLVTIRDNGGGIEEGILTRIFDPYFTTKGPDKGTGIGLHISKSIIEKSMDGRLSVRNVDGGAEFRVEI